MSRRLASAPAMDVALLAAALVAYNNLLNRWPPFHGPPYVVVNAAAGAVLAALALGPLGLVPEDLGLGGRLPAHLWLGVALGAALTAPLFALAATRRGARIVADRRTAGLRGATLAYHVLVRIPVGTAGLEEVAFRGVLLGAALRWGALPATVVASVAFGLWHIAPTINLVEANRPGATRRDYVMSVAGAVVATAGAGALLAWLRLATGGLAAPWALHASLNGFATLASVRAHRRLAQPPS